MSLENNAVFGECSDTECLRYTVQFVVDQCFLARSETLLPSFGGVAKDAFVPGASAEESARMYIKFKG